MVAQRNWSAIPGIDAEVQTLLNACIEAGGPDSLEMEALQQIRHAYENGIRSVSDSSAEIEKQIDALHARKEGWMAYAALAGLEERMK
ncbi:hypothetical protein WJ39_27130 [Burkholderia diffusa]|nr:hypothetical protein WJ39_27130 [Burkholderia diffusa]